MRIAAGIITYNPEIDILIKNLEILSVQVDAIIIVDNASNNYKIIERSICDFSKVCIICNNINLGVSKALNKIFKIAKEMECKWCMVMDQDSILKKDFVSIYKQYISNNDVNDVGILCPQIYDRNQKNNVETSDNIVSKISCINSGAFVCVEKWLEIGGYDEHLFVDLVDYDFSIRMRENNYLILQLNNQVLNHSIGNISTYKVFSHTVVVYNHSAIRKFYLAEASIYLSYKHKAVRKKYRYTQHVYLRCIKRIMLVILFEDNKLKKSCAIIKGIISGNRLYGELKKC